MNPSALSPSATVDLGASSENDSLLAGVQWFCAHYDKPATLESLYAGLPRGQRLKPSLVVRMLEQAGIGAGWVKRRPAELSSYLFPLMLLFKNGEARILVARRGEQFELVVPEAGGGTMTLSAEELQENYLAMRCWYGRRLPRMRVRRSLRGRARHTGCSPPCGAIAAITTARHWRPF